MPIFFFSTDTNLHFHILRNACLAWSRWLTSGATAFLQFTACLQSVLAAGIGVPIRAIHFCALPSWQGKDNVNIQCRSHPSWKSANWSYVQFSSVAQSYLTLCDPMNRSTLGLPVHHQLPESTQTHVHRVGDAIQPSYPLLSPSPPALNLSQHQGLFQ